MPFPCVSLTDRTSGNYPKWNKNSQFEKDCLKQVGLPEDYHPTEEEAERIVIAALEGS
jgi:hypothetical protein